MDKLILLDKHLFEIVNRQWSNSFFDWLMPWLRNSVVWAPLYIFLILFTVINYKKTGWWWVLFAIITVSITDTISSKIIKENIIRLRPCNDTLLASWINILVGYKPQSSSFTSSHATNHFGLAMYVYVTYKNLKLNHNYAFLLFIWAFLICYAQVYVGVHFPFDVLCGAILGIFIGYLPAKLFNNKFGLN